MTAAIVIPFVGAVGLARLSGHWHTALPEALYFDLVPRASEFGHR